jgi:hypothetical protein
MCPTDFDKFWSHKDNKRTRDQLVELCIIAHSYRINELVGFCIGRIVDENHCTADVCSRLVAANINTILIAHKLARGILIFEHSRCIMNYPLPLQRQLIKLLLGHPGGPSAEISMMYLPYLPINDEQMGKLDAKYIQPLPVGDLKSKMANIVAKYMDGCNTSAIMYRIINKYAGHVAVRPIFGPS